MGRFQLLFMVTFLVGLSVGSQAQNLTPAEARSIAKEAYIYGFPMVDSYRIQYLYFADKQSPEFKATWNELRSIPRVYTPQDTAVQTPNSDTPYSMIGMDLRTEPLVVHVPAIDKTRYYSIQFVDAYTHNFDYIGSRTTGNDGGDFLVAGPRWTGKTPKGIAKVIRSETDFVLGVYRTQLFDPQDLENVRKVQAGYKVTPLSDFLLIRAPTAAAEIRIIKPLSPAEQKSSLEFFNILNFALQYTVPDASEKDILARFARIGVGAGKIIHIKSLSPEIREAISAGIADAWAAFAKLKEEKLDTGQVTSGDLFGTRAYLKNNYLYRMAAAALGIYGNSKEEAMYPMYLVDSAAQKLDGGNKYTIHFEPNALPPVNAFWSLTMYELPSSLLVENRLNRYLLNSSMLPTFVKDPDGGLTLFIQNESPGKEKEANWLPAPKGPFFMAMRLYWPKDEAVSGKWKAPLLISVK